MIQKKLKANTLKFMKYVFLILSIVLFFSCSAQQKITTQVVLLTDSIQKPYTYLNEIKIISNNEAFSNKVIKVIQQISENKYIKVTIPEKRLALKKKLFEECFNLDISKCKYVPEKYKILSNNNNILNIKYSYNSFSNPNEWYKYACFDLKTTERITHDKIFIDSDKVLKKYNHQYILKFNEYLKNNKQETEEDRDEYEIYKEHLKTKTPFQLVDLNNVEFRYDNTNRIKHIRFHYNGMSGVYSQLFPADYIEFTANELMPCFKNLFKNKPKNK